LLKRTWLEHASRIKRRVTSDGGSNNAFFRDALKALAQHPLHATLDEFYVTQALEKLEHGFFFAEDKFTLFQLRHEMFSEVSVAIPLHDFIRNTLESYSSENPAL
jgi:hypothetical protein